MYSLRHPRGDAGASGLLYSMYKHAVVVRGGFNIQKRFFHSFLEVSPFGLLKVEAASKRDFRLCYGRLDHD